jgi:hypothetical protein
VVRGIGFDENGRPKLITNETDAAGAPDGAAFETKREIVL